MRTVDLFAGCGGLSLGFQNAGFNIVSAFDNWDFAVNVYIDNFTHSIYKMDLSSRDCIDIINKINPEFIIGGPPCQDFSSAGKRDETLGRANLTLHFANIIAAINPQWFVMENVERITKSNILNEVISIFKKSNYGLTAKVVNASYCGVPQARKRFFMIGKKNISDNFLLPYLEKNQSKKPMTLFDFFGNSLGLEYYYRHPRSYMRRGIFSIYEPSPTIRGVNRPIPDNYKKHKSDPVAITSDLRPLTTRERSLIQTFPDNFIFNGSKTNLEQVIGNAVPVKLAEFVARCIKEYIEDSKENKIFPQEKQALLF